MDCDIHSHAERRNADGAWEDIPELAPFDWRSYGMYGFLAGVRNYSAVTPIAEPRNIPDDASKVVKSHFEAWECDAHNASWLSVTELVEFDYDTGMEDRRIARQVGMNSWNGGCTAEAGEGRATTYREFLGEGFFEELAKLKTAGVERIVFWFDN